MLGQLLDGVAAVPQDALVAVEEGDGAAARGRVHECRVVGHQPEVVGVGLDLAQVHGADRAVGDRKFVRLTGPIVSIVIVSAFVGCVVIQFVPSMRLRRGGPGVPSVRQQVYLCGTVGGRRPGDAIADRGAASRCHTGTTGL